MSHSISILSHVCVRAVAGPVFHFSLKDKSKHVHVTCTRACPQPRTYTLSLSLPFVAPPPPPPTHTHTLHINYCTNTHTLSRSHTLTLSLAISHTLSLSLFLSPQALSRSLTLSVEQTYKVLQWEGGEGGAEGVPRASAIVLDLLGTTLSLPLSLFRTLCLFSQ